jgi:6-pyruvoyltetrahydropterin/6-carboxytetrahydropterin synthase
MHIELTRTFFAEAAHANPKGDARRQRVHGHSYRIELVVAGKVTSPNGWLIDYGDIKRAFAPLYAQLDHRFLNEDVDGLDDPSLPGLRAWLWERCRDVIPMLRDVRVSIVGDCVFAPVLLEPDEFRGLPARWRLTFESAQSLCQLPDAHPCHSLHGHSYRLEIGAAEMDRLREALPAYYDLLDHRCLDDVEGLANSTCEHIARWLWERLDEQGLEPSVVVLQETEASRAIYRGE